MQVTSNNYAASNVRIFPFNVTFLALINNSQKEADWTNTKL